MGYKLREIAAESKFSQELALDAIAQAVPLSADQGGAGRRSGVRINVSAN